MKRSLKHTAFGTIAAALALGAAMPASAKPPHCPPGHEKKGWCGDRHHDRHDSWDDRRDEARAYEEGYREGQRDAIRYNGRTYSDYRVIEDYDRYGLDRPPNGYYYADVDGDVMMVQVATQLVTQLLSSRGY